MKSLYNLLLLLLMSLLTSCVQSNTLPNKSYKARITFYSSDKKWGNRVADTKIRYAKESITIAAHPDFAFGTKIYIPQLKNKFDDGVFIVQDRGSAVTKKRASRGKSYVFDVYVSTHRKVKSNAKHNAEYMTIYIL